MSQLPAKVTLCDANGNPLIIQAGSAGLFVVDPNATPDGNLYASFQAAASAAKAAGPGTEILIVRDTTVEGVDHDITGVRRIRGLPNETPTLTFADGASLRDDYNVFEFENVAISFGGTIKPVISVPTNGGATITLGPYASISTTNTASKGFVESDGGLIVDARYGNNISGSSGHQAIKLTSGGNAQIRIGDFGSLAANTITGGGSGAFEVTDLSKAGGAAAASISQSQAGTTAVLYD